MSLPYDQTWANPTPQQLAALETATLIFKMHKPAGLFHGLNETSLAEWIILSPNSLWYTQAKAWMTNPPPATPPTWQLASMIIATIVEAGFDEQSGQWWDLKAIFPDKVEQAAMIIALMDFGMMIPQFRQRPDILSRGHDLFVDIICGPGWQHRYERFLKHQAPSPGTSPTPNRPPKTKKKGAKNEPAK